MAKYSECPSEVFHLAEKLIDQFHPYLKECKIGFVMVDEPPMSGGKTVVAKVSKVPEKLRPYIPDELDMLVTISETIWVHFGSEGHKAIIDHELCHIILSDNGFKTRAHDIEEFQEIIERYGLWNRDLMAAHDALYSATQMAFSSPDFQPGGSIVKVKSFVAEKEK